MKIILQLLCLLHPVTGSRFTLTSHKLFWLDIFINIRNFDFVEFELDRLVAGQDEAEAPLLATRRFDRHERLHLDLVLSVGVGAGHAVHVPEEPDLPLARREARHSLQKYL